MAKTSNGTFKVPGGFEVNNNKPVDDRMVVQTDADLLVDTNADGTLKTTELYKGIIVYSEESETHYVWNGLDRTNAENWVAIGGDKCLWELIQENPYNLKVPTEQEWQDEIDTWATDQAIGFFDNVLKITLAGRRFDDDGSIFNEGEKGYYYTSTTNEQFQNFSNYILFISEVQFESFYKSRGYSVRLIVEGNFTQQDFDDNYANKTVTINGLNYGFVYNPTTQKIWLDRNLGATQVATSLTDANAYGDLFQWGRGADGHEKRDSNTTNVQATSPQPGHGDFIIGFNNWLTPDNDNLWQGPNEINNPAGNSDNEKLIGKNGKKASYNDLLDKPDSKTFENDNASGVVDIDLSIYKNASKIKLHFTGNGSITFSNTPAVGKGQTLSIIITTATGAETVSMPATSEYNYYGSLDLSTRNKVFFEFSNFTSSGLNVDVFQNLNSPGFSGDWRDLDNRPIAAVEDMAVSGSKLVNITQAQSHYWNLTGNTNLIFNNIMLLNQSYVSLFEITTETGIEVLFFDNVATDRIIGTFDPTKTNKMRVEQVYFPTQGIITTVYIHQL